MMIDKNSKKPSGAATNLTTGTGDFLETNQLVLLHDGYPVTQAFYDSVKQQVDEVMPVLEFDKKYTLEMLCSPEFWVGLGNGNRRIAGRCMSDMVIRNILPMIVADSAHEYPKYYSPK